MLALLSRITGASWFLPVASAIGAALVAVTITRWYYTGEIAKMKLAWETARAEAIATALTEQKRVDAVTMDAALAAAKAEVKTVTVTNTIIKWNTKYVKEIAGCPSTDMLRVHDAAALGADPASLQESAGQPDGKPAAVGTSDFSSAIAENYGRCRVTAARLTGLQAWVRDVCEK